MAQWGWVLTPMRLIKFTGKLDLEAQGSCDCGGAVELDVRDVYILRVLHLALIWGLGRLSASFYLPG